MHYHFIRLQSSKSDILEGLDLWRATVIKHESAHKSLTEGVPWSNAESLYETIDAIQDGDTPWKCFKFLYTGPKPLTPPAWMEETYELNTRDVLLVLEQQLATSEFDGQIDYVPYREFTAKGDRIYSNLMSAHWAYREATFSNYAVSQDKIVNDPLTHGSMLVPVIAGSDKTTVSVATGHQEYHPVYVSPGVITNTARHGHGVGVLPVAFLPIPKTSKRQRKHTEFQLFCRQLYHRCLELVFEPLKAYMETYKVVRCPDGHFRRAIFSLGPYIADYPEQVWLTGIVSNWCPKCDATPDNLDGAGSHRRSHEKTDFLIKTFDPGILWDDFGIRHDIVPFTHSFPRADIHELLAPDLLHQLIKGVFKDHLVTWVGDYLHETHGEKLALEIVEDIDHRISAVPPYQGLLRFPDGRDYNQWTGDDSKALMKVYLAAIAGYLPSSMVQCVAAFMDSCYIARRNAITGPALMYFQECVDRFHALQNVFIEAGVRTSISLPRQHALNHYFYSIHLFGSPNGLCSSITESKHIKAVKEPWRRSSRYQALIQMLRTLLRIDKIGAIRRRFTEMGMMKGNTASYMAERKVEDVRSDCILDHDDEVVKDSEDDEDESLLEAVPGDLSDDTMSDIRLSIRFGMPSCFAGSFIYFLPVANKSLVLDSAHPRGLESLAKFINQPKFPHAFRRFLFDQTYPNEQAPTNISELPAFGGSIKVHRSATATYYAPSDLCGSGGLHREIIRSSRSFHGHERRDTAFVVLDESKEGMEGMEIGRVLLFFSFQYRRKDYSCALINWFVHDNEPDPDTGMWTVQLECDQRGQSTVDVIDIDAIARGAHLLPIYGSFRVPDDFIHHNALDSFNSFFVNHYIDHHAHEFIKLI
ncbi:hypothetical protein HYPSUDRAFT_145683 [Hypholoma sublateritium FD-334 SS-4]|uniref:Uncharacterized protein n=1 Tax=Hypholoma sublateritium (strain FD-334 SS-4) TaxID=945553 RepID=A0A0D2PCI7_HYPSF|nr:hypothetical protein HYPSUDRAFT_145683 [Hypholoma sublateritium FD-334 SS-4]